MVLLILIAVAQLGVSLLILGALSSSAAQPTSAEAAERSIHAVERQAIDAMFAAADGASAAKKSVDAS